MFNFFKKPKPEPEVTPKILAEMELNHKVQPTPPYHCEDFGNLARPTKISAKPGQWRLLCG